MLDKPYAFTFLGRGETGVNDPTHIAKYRFRGSVRKYLVVFETLSCGFVEFKFHALADQRAKNRYRKKFNDGDGIRVISTCMNIIFDYWKQYPYSSFWLYAVPRNTDPGVYMGSRTDSEYKVVRYSIFKKNFQNTFSPDDFHHLHDDKAMIYVLINRNVQNPMNTLTTFTNYLMSKYTIIFSPNT